MSNFEEGINQAKIAVLGDIAPPRVNKFIKENNIPNIDKPNTKFSRYSIEDCRKIILNLSKLPRVIKKKRQVFSNLKGGVGKTTMCYQVSAHLALMGYKVLVIDSDAQANFTTTCGIDYNNQFYTIYDCIIKDKNIKEATKEIYQGFYCIPSNGALARLEPDLAKLDNYNSIMQKVLAPIEDEFDFIFIDASPSLNISNKVFQAYVDIIHIVCETQPYSVDGLKKTFEELIPYFDYIGKEVCDINIIPNKYEYRTISSAESMAALKRYYSEYLKTDFAIRRSEDFVLTTKVHKPLSFFAKTKSNAMEDVIELLHYIIQKSTL